MKKSQPRSAIKQRQRVSQDDELVSELLNQKSGKRRQAFTPDVSEFKKFKRSAKEASARVISQANDFAQLQLEYSQLQLSNKRNLNEINSLRIQHEKDELRIKEMTYENAQLAKEIETLKDQLGNRDKKWDKQVDKVKKSMQEIQASMSSRNHAVKKISSKVSKLLTRLTHFVQEQAISQPSRNQMTRVIKEIESNIDSLSSPTTSSVPAPVKQRARSVAPPNPEPQKSTEESEAIAKYREIVDKLRYQIGALRNKLSSKKEQIHTLTISVQSTQKMLSQYEHEIADLRRSQSVATQPYTTMDKTEQQETLFLSGDEESDSQTAQIKDDIANLDIEIQNLQTSLRKALEN